MKRISVILSVLLVTTASMAVSLPTPSAAAPSPAVVGGRAGRMQFGLAASGPIAVWVDQAAPTGAIDAVSNGSADIVGFDYKANQPIDVTNAPGDQLAPAISNGVVVWEDRRQSCPTCESDIRGKDLNTGIEFAIASGPADQSAPAIAGRTLVWKE